MKAAGRNRFRERHVRQMLEDSTIGADMVETREHP